MNCLTAFLKKTGHLEEIIRDICQMEDPPDSAFLSPGFGIGDSGAGTSLSAGTDSSFLVTHLERGLDAFELEQRAKALSEGERMLEVERKQLRDEKAEVEQLYQDLRDSTNDQYYRLCEEQKQRLKDIYHEKWARAVASASWYGPPPVESENHEDQEEPANVGVDVLELEADYGEVQELVAEVN